MANSDITYCKGNRCALREHCVRYVEGLSLPDGNWWWMDNCDETIRDGFVETV